MNFVFLSGCGFCKKLKPDFALAATELKREAVSFELSINLIIIIWHKF